MIKSNDLRLGNLILWNGEIRDIGKGSIVFLDSYNEEDFEEFSGIPLTTEILQECGFVKNENGIFVNNQVWIDAGFKFTPVYCEGSFKRFIGKGIIHLHELQNLYYALTGEELNYNPTVQVSDTTTAS